MILTHDEILKEIRAKRIKIEPFDIQAVGPASIDLSLGQEIRIFKRNRKNNPPVKVEENIDYKKMTCVVDLRRGYILKPKELIMGITSEKITLPPDICGWLNSRSRFARVGLMSHITAPFICPGVSNHQVLEIFNASSQSLHLVPGVKICQLILQRCQGKSSYKGMFKHQTLEDER